MSGAYVRLETAMKTQTTAFRFHSGRAFFLCFWKLRILFSLEFIYEAKFFLML